MRKRSRVAQAHGGDITWWWSRSSVASACASCCLPAPRVRDSRISTLPRDDEPPFFSLDEAASSSSSSFR